MHVRVGIVGVGVMGADHARILVDGVAGATLAAVQDADAARAADVASSSRDVRVFGSAADLIADEAIDAVLIASPDATHEPLVLACIEHRKPALCEKPLAATLEGCRAIVAAEARAGTRLVQVGYMRRFDPGYRAMQAGLAEARIGAALFMHCVHRNAVAPHFITADLVISNAAVHEIDIARFVLGEDLVAATVISARASGKAPSRRPQFIVLETASGAVVDIEAFLDAQYGYDVRAELVGETGTLALAPHPPVALRQDGIDGARLDADWRGRFAAAYREQLTAWIGSVRTGVPAGASAWDGYVASATAEACLAAYRSGTRTRVTLDDRPALYE